jgi:hypothetical protein
MTFDAWLESKHIFRKHFEIYPKYLQNEMIEEYNQLNKSIARQAVRKN